MMDVRMFTVHLVETASLAPLSNYGQLTLLRYAAHEQQYIDMPRLIISRYFSSQTSQFTNLVFLRTATSFLNAVICAGVGSLTLRVLMATAPCQCPL